VIFPLEDEMNDEVLVRVGVYGTDHNVLDMGEGELSLMRQWIRDCDYRAGVDFLQSGTLIAEVTLVPISKMSG
jgi:hypothetical protein